MAAFPDHDRSSPAQAQTFGRALLGTGNFDHFK
jgi:hypothetical protein